MFAGIVYPNPFENDPILFSPCCAPVLCGQRCGTSGHPAGFFRRGKAGFAAHDNTHWQDLIEHGKKLGIGQDTYELVTIR